MDYSREIRNFIYAKSGNSQRAEDITQEAFIRLWNNCSKVAQEKARAFLYTVSTNLFKDTLRHDKVVLAFKANVSSDQDMENPQFLLELQEFKGQLETVLAQMPEGSRVAFLMNRIDGLTYQEIAERLGISKKAVEKRMSGALKMIRELMEIKKRESK